MPAESLSPFKVCVLQVAIPQYKADLFRALAKLEGFNIHFIVGDRAVPSYEKSDKLQDITVSVVRQYYLRVFKATLLWQSCLIQIIKLQPNILLLPDGVFYLSNYCLLLICKLLRVRVIFYTHGFNHRHKFGTLSGYVERLRGFTFAMADALVTYSDQCAQDMIRRHRLPSNRIFVARNTLNIEAIRSSVCSTTPARVDSDAFKVIFFGRLVKEKNPDWVIYAVSHCRNNGLNVEATLCGDGAMFPILQDLIAKMNLGDLITLTGKLDMQDLSARILDSSLVVMPGVTGLAIVHAFALGRPLLTVASESHSPEIDYLIPWENGMVCESNLEAFSASVASLAQSREEVGKMGRAAYAYATEFLGQHEQVEGFRRAFDFVTAEK